MSKINDGISTVEKKITSFLMIGQSNMAGRGYLHEARDIDTSRIYILRNGRWQPMFRPINPDRSFSGVSLAESFAEHYGAMYQTVNRCMPGVDMTLIDKAVEYAK